MTILPPFVPGNPRNNRIVPFTIRDGESYLAKLERLAVYLRNMVPLLNDALIKNDEYFAEQINEALSSVNAAIVDLNQSVDAKLDEHTTELTADINASVTQIVAGFDGRLAEVNRILNEFLNSQTSANDAVTRSLIAGPSQTRDELDDVIATDLTAERQWTQERLDEKSPTGHTHSRDGVSNNGSKWPGAYTESATTTASGVAEIADDSEVQALTDRVRIVTPGGLGAWWANLFPKRNRAVFVGSSNALNGATDWPQRLCTAMNLEMHNYADGGQGYQSSQYLAQVAAAANGMNSAQRAEVGLFFVADASNDVRGGFTYAQIVPLARAVYAQIRASFPNAKIVVLPQIWPADAEKFAPTASFPYNPQWNARAVALAAAQADALSDYRNSLFIDQSWTWLHGNDNTMVAAANVHPNSGGHALIARYVERALSGELIMPDTGWQYLPLPSGYDAGHRGDDLMIRRKGWGVKIKGSRLGNASMTLNGNNDYAIIPYGYRPTYEYFLSATVSDAGGHDTNFPILMHVYQAGNFRRHNTSITRKGIVIFDGYEIG